MSDHMTSAEHRTEALRLIGLASEPFPDDRATLQAAQVHATLALRETLLELLGDSSQVDKLLREVRAS